MLHLRLRLPVDRADARGHQQSFAPSARDRDQRDGIRLNGWRAILAVLACSLPVFSVSSCRPLILMRFASPSLQRRIDRGLRYAPPAIRWCSRYLAAAFAVCLGLVLAYADRAMPQRFTVRYADSLASMGYAMPGTVMGIGVLIPFAAFDNSIDSIHASSSSASRPACFSRARSPRSLSLCRAVSCDLGRLHRKRPADA